MSASLLTDYVLGRAAERGDKPAVIDAATDETITFAELPERIEQASRALHHQGLRSGMYAAVRMANGPYLPVVQHAILSLGAVTVSLNALTSEVETGAAMAQTGELADIPDLVENPVWQPKAKYEGDTYPKKALEANKTGQAGIICTVLADGKMDKCFVEFEDPEGFGFGQWLVGYSKVLSVKTTDAKGASIVGKKVSYIMDFKPTKK